MTDSGIIKTVSEPARAKGDDQLIQAVVSHLGRIAESTDPKVQSAAHQLKRALDKSQRRN